MATTAAAAPTDTMTAVECRERIGRPESRGRWWELDRGRVTEMSPPQAPHGTLCGWIAHLLWSFAIRRGRGQVTTSDTGLVVEENTDTVRGVDVMFFDASTRFDQIPAGYETTLPALVVEVRSPSDRLNAMSRRIAQYLARGVPLAWVVDPEDQTAGIHCGGGELPIVAFDDDELPGFTALPDLNLRAKDLFTLPGQAPTPAQPQP